MIQAAAATPLRMLIVEDEVEVAGFVREVAEELAYAVTEVHHGSDFFDAYERGPADVIVLDLNLPGHDGVELLRYLGEKGCQASIIITSGRDSRILNASRVIGEQYNLQIGGTLPKPLTVDSLEEMFLRLRKAEPKLDRETLRRAIDNDELQILYQPKLSLLTSSYFHMDGIEALVRWVRPDGRSILPDAFLPTVQEFGMMHELTDLVLDKALTVTRTWQDQGLDLSTSINLDRATLNDLSLPNHLAERAASHNVNPSRITLEITETAVMEDPKAAMDVLTRLRVKGFSIAMDDFGTGYSSLVQLYRLPFSELKIDKSFVMDIGKNSEAGVIVEALAMLAKKLGLKVCAEGIEDETMLNHVRACGCDLGQGFFFSEAVTGDEIGRLAKVWEGAESIHRLRSAAQE
ncbi:MAG: EAL domain-containing response regulator [Hyphomicrobiales bacterium]|nr:EAL domain-containing response regulator [Hyphomicrobiales bacterium]